MQKNLPVGFILKGRSTLMAGTELVHVYVFINGKYHHARAHARFFKIRVRGTNLLLIDLC